jgi:hypothetical protein
MPAPDAPDPELVALSRQAWGALETLHVVGYFAPEVRSRYVDLGLHPELSYFPARAAALGPAGPALTIATFYVFAPWLVEAALPAAWETVTPEQLVDARRAGMADALGRVLGEPDVAEALALAREVCQALTPQGRPLHAAHAALRWPQDDLVALWHAATLVREHRGDGHVAVLQHAGLDPVEATVLGGLHASTTRFLRRTRGWSDDEYDAASTRLRRRGWLDDEGRLSPEGRAERQRIEDDTDRLALEGWAHLGVEGTSRLHQLLEPLREQVVASGMIDAVRR